MYQTILRLLRVSITSTSQIDPDIADFSVAEVPKSDPMALHPDEQPVFLTHAS